MSEPPREPELRDRIRKFPDSPGVYLFRDPAGKVLYVGKAVSLRKRVASYVGERQGRDPKTRALMARVRDVEYILAGDEREALLLEDNLIKKHRPRYNVLMRDDKSYPYLCLTMGEEFPRIRVTRRPSPDGSLYYGPYPQMRVKDLYDLLRRHFKLCDCKEPRVVPIRRACLRHALGQCSGPCIGAVTRQEYARHVERARMFLEGRHDPLSMIVRREMEAASSSQRYEEAARARDLLATLSAAAKTAVVVTTRRADVDAVALAEGWGRVSVAVLQMREGKVVGHVKRVMDNPMGLPLPEVLPLFLEQHYVPGVHLPSEILVPRGAAPSRGWIDRVREPGNQPLRVTTAVRGWRRRLMRLAESNVLESVKEEAERLAVLRELGQVLGMSRIPRTMACFDVSTLQGVSTVGSAVFFTDGKPDPSRYRKFRMKRVSGVDDYESHREMMDRYLRLLEREGQSPPDLFLIDGGKGQVEAVRPLLQPLLEDGHGLAGLAKRDEEVFVPGKTRPLDLEGKRRARHLLMRARDEAHRFAHGYHRILRQQTLIRSALREIPGVGPVRTAALLRRFGSLAGVRNAGVAEIASVKGFTQALAERVHSTLSRGLENNPETA